MSIINAGTPNCGTQTPNTGTQTPNIMTITPNTATKTPDTSVKTPDAVTLGLAKSQQAIDKAQVPKFVIAKP